jgi:hypothetical protein
MSIAVREATTKLAFLARVRFGLGFALLPSSVRASLAFKYSICTARVVIERVGDANEANLRAQGAKKQIAFARSIA